MGTLVWAVRTTEPEARVPDGVGVTVRLTLLDEALSDISGIGSTSPRPVTA